MSKAQTNLFKVNVTTIAQDQIAAAFPVTPIWKRNGEKKPVKTGDTYGALFTEFFS